MSEETVALARQGAEAFNRRDVEWVVAHASPDVEWYPAIAGEVEAQPFLGHEGMREFFRELDEIWEEFGLEVEEIRDLGERVLVLSQVRAVGKTGVKFEQSLDAVWEIREGQIIRGRSYLDRAKALEAAATADGQERV
jgi:ketosteroid isomerase-like protein